MPKTGESGEARHARMVRKLEDSTEPMVQGGAGALFGTNAASNAATAGRNQQRRRALVGDAGPRNATEDNFNRATGRQPSSVQAPAASSDLFEEVRPTGLRLGEDPAEVAARGEDYVSPEEQAQYERIVKNAGRFIYANPKKIVAALNQNDMPVHKAVGRVAANMAQMIEQSAAKGGEKLNPDTLWHAGSEVIEMLMDLGVQAKVFPLDPESERYQQEAAMAFMEAEKIIGEGMLKDPEKGTQYADEAGDVWAWQVAQEVDRGEADPAYQTMVDNYRQNNDPITKGVRSALGPGRG